MGDLRAAAVRAGLEGGAVPDEAGRVVEAAGRADHFLKCSDRTTPCSPSPSTSRLPLVVPAIFFSRSQSPVGPGRGAAQWEKGGRFDALEQMGKTRAAAGWTDDVPGWMSPQLQIDYVAKELKTTHAHVGRALAK